MRSYDQFCGLARSLDLVGDRWTLLILRELLLGDRRFTDLVDGLPGIPRNLLSARLAELSDEGLLERVDLSPPTAVTIYRLTDVGADIEPVLLALTRWGFPHLGDPGGQTVRGAWFGLLIAAWGNEQPPPDRGELEVRLPSDTFHLQLDGAAIRSRHGPAPQPRAAINVGWRDLLDLLTRSSSLDDLTAEEGNTVEGDVDFVDRFLEWLVGNEATRTGLAQLSAAVT
jgi:DNA-binding HxlR family transcriptional regulator